LFIWNWLYQKIMLILFSLLLLLVRFFWCPNSLDRDLQLRSLCCLSL
jgi:hypothetical protein